MSNNFTCEFCKKTYEKAWSEEEALEEKNRLFPNDSMEDMAIICDDCLNENIINRDKMSGIYYSAWKRK